MDLDWDTALSTSFRSVYTTIRYLYSSNQIVYTQFTFDL